MKRSIAVIGVLAIVVALLGMPAVGTAMGAAQEPKLEDLAYRLDFVDGGGMMQVFLNREVVSESEVFPTSTYARKHQPPFVQDIFYIEGVRSVYLRSRVISVAKERPYDWSEIQPRVLAVLEKWLVPPDGKLVQVKPPTRAYSREVIVGGSPTQNQTNTETSTSGCAGMEVPPGATPKCI